MSYFYLKAADEAALWAALEAAGLVTPEMAHDGIYPHEITLNDGGGISVIGVIEKPNGETQVVGGIEMPVMTPIPGFHVNVWGELNEEQIAMLPLVPAPKTPHRVLA